MLSSLLFFAALVLCGGFSVFMRIRWNGYRQEYALTSPWAEAIRQLVGIAGGIYLSLVMLSGFLGLNLPERIYVRNIQLDPLAVLAIGLACVQPFVLSGWHRILKRGESS